jgi:hypothetical protein
MAEIKKSFFTFGIVVVILAISAVIIAYGRGYRFDAKKKTIGSTGLVSVTSDPIGATIAIDGKNVGATNTTVTIKPGWYTITISKEGYQLWEKKIRVQGEILVSTHAILFPTNPSLSAITASGVTRPVLSPDGTKIAFIIPKEETPAANGQTPDKSGIWILDLIDKPLGLNRDARQILTSNFVTTDTAHLTWSPDSKQLLVDIPAGKNGSISYLADTDKLNTALPAIPVRSDVLTDWVRQTNLKEKEKLSTLSPEFLAVATSSMRIISFSPDERNILYEATAAATLPAIISPPMVGVNSTPETRGIKPKTIYVYDVKEDRNYVIGDASALTLQWLPSSRQLLAIGKTAIDVFDWDGTNRKTVYAGPFLEGFAVPWTNAGKLVILTNLNASASAIPNLYAVNIK